MVPSAYPLTKASAPLAPDLKCSPSWPKRWAERIPPKPRVIHTDGHGAYPPAVARLKEEGALGENRPFADPRRQLFHQGAKPTIQPHIPKSVASKFLTDPGLV
jgi:hypothetical protein